MSKTIIFIHGAWVTPECWESFRSFYEAKGYQCLAPAWPYLDRPISELRRQPANELAQQSIGLLVDHFEREIKKLPEPPILIGHSFGGLIVQLLLDRGLGRAGVAIDAAPPRGVLPSLTALRSALPVLLAWQSWKRVLTMSFASFSSTFANTLSPAEQRLAYDRYIVPAPGRIYLQAALGLGNSVHFANPNRAPLLLIAGEEDKTSTASMVESMYRKHQRSPVSVDIRRFPHRSHWLIAESGWEEVAQEIQVWIENKLSVR